MSVTRPSPRMLRAMSDDAVVRALMDARAMTRSEIATNTGLSKPTVTQAVRRLVDKGLVRDTGERTTTRGGVGAYYSMAESIGHALVVQIAPEGIVAEVVDAAGRQVSGSARAVDRSAAPNSVRRQLTAAARAAVRDLPDRQADLAVVSVADPVDRVSGRLVQLPESPFLIGELDPVAALRSLVDGDVTVDNDVNWAARHEIAARSADGASFDDFAYLFLGEGLGCAVVSDGEVRRGHSGLAGEVAYVLTVGPSGAARTFTAVFDELGLRFRGSAAIDIDALLAALDTESTLDAVVTATAGVLAALVSVLDPSTVVLGGAWGVDPRFAGRLAAVVGSNARPVAVESARGSPGGPLAGARRDAVHRLREALAARGRED